MDNFVYQNPTKIIFGKGTIGQIGEQLASYKIHKVLLVYGQGSIKANGCYDKVISSLKKSAVEYIEFGGIRSNPTLEKVNEAIIVAMQNSVNGILAIGGGSVIDSAKAISVGVTYGGNIWDIFESKAEIRNSLPLFTVLTLSATASEMNSGAVITNEKEKKKWSFTAGEFSAPRVSIIDPTVQFSLPAKQTVYGIVDSITHVLEYYFNGVGGVEIQDQFSEALVRTIIKHGTVLLDDPVNYESRAQLAWCSTMALNGINAIGRFGGDFASHTIEHSISAFYPNVAHAAGLAVIFPNWMKYVCSTDFEKFAQFATHVFGLKDDSKKNLAYKGINTLQNFYKSIKAPVTLKELGVKLNDIEIIAENTVMKGAIGRFVKLEKQDVVNILKSSYN